MRRLVAAGVVATIAAAAAFAPEARTDEPDPAAMLLPAGLEVVDTATFLDPSVGPPVELAETGFVGEPVVPEATVVVEGG